VPQLAREHGVAKKARTFLPWSHIVALLYTQLAHALSLNDVCDSLRNHAAKLFTIRRATPPSRNALSYANRNRDAAMAEALFWSVLKHLTAQSPGFAGRTYGGMPRRFKRVINVVDASTIQLVANCIDWARHRRKKAAAKLHLRLDLASFLPRFIIIDTARHNDNKCARALCGGIDKGEIVIFDKAYVDFEHLLALTQRGVFWVTRAKDNMQYQCRKRLLKKPSGNILRDDLILLTSANTREKYPQLLRRVHAVVTIDGKVTEMVFISNNTNWAPSSIADLYQSRWAIETFFKQIKQTLQLSDFLGHSKNAILWQIWTALLLYVLLRYLAYVNHWQHSFKRIFCLLRACLWDGLNLSQLLISCGIAHGGNGSIKLRAAPEQAYLPGLQPN